MKSEELNVSLKKCGFPEKYRIYVTYFSVCCMVFMNGTINGWTSPIIKKLNDTIDNPVGRKLTVDESSWIASISTLAVITGAFLCGIMGKYMKRKALMEVMAAPYLIFCLTFAFTKSIWLYIFARFLAGLTAGACVGVVPMYIAELSKPEQRGRLFLVSTVASNLGSLYSYSAGSYLSFFWFHMSLTIAPIIFHFLFSIFAYESPYSIIRKDPVKAEKLLKKLREKDNVSEEMKILQEDLQRGSGISLMKIFKTKGTRRALFISIGLGSSVMLSGSATVLSYSQLIFETAGGVWSAEVNSIVLSAFQLVASIVVSPFADKFGRRTILSVSFFVAAFSEIVLGIYLILADEFEMGSVFKILPLVSLMVFVAALSLINMAPSISGELFSLEAKDAAMALGIVISGVLGFGNMFLFQRIVKAIGLGITFFIFAGILMCGVVFVRLFLIETRGKTLEEIQEELNGNKKKFFK